MKKLQILTNVGSKLTNLTGRTGLQIRKFSPEILIVLGVVGIVGSTILACKATLKLDEVADDSQDVIARIHERRDNPDVPEERYTEKDANKDLYINYVQTAVKIGKLYAPAVGVGILSIGAILCSYKILSKRNFALMAAYKGIDEAFAKYRSRVVADAGTDKDKEYRYGVKKDSEVKVIYDKDGNEIDRVREDVKIVDPNELSMYSKYFDETSLNWNRNPEYNMVFLKCTQSHVNDLLHARGHVFLNEVYDMLGVKRTQAGSVVGWVMSAGDDFIDFGIFDQDVSGYRDIDVNDTVAEERRDFVNGRTPNVLLDFNVAGVVWNKI